MTSCAPLRLLRRAAASAAGPGRAVVLTLAWLAPRPFIDHPSVGAARILFEREGEEWTVVDREGRGIWSIGGVPLLAREPRIVRPTHRVVAGDFAFVVTVDEAPFAAELDTRRIALEAVARFAARAPPHGPRIRVVEGAHRGRTLDLARERTYVIGRAETSDLTLVDARVSREQLSVTWLGAAVVVKDLASATGSYVARDRLQPRRAAVWEPDRMLRIASTVLALELPEDPSQLLARIGDGPPREPPVEPESAVDASVAPAASFAAPEHPAVTSPVTSAPGGALANLASEVIPPAPPAVRRAFPVLVAFVVILTLLAVGLLVWVLLA